MLVAAHVIQVLLLGLAPWLLARTFARRWARPAAIFGVGLLCFVFAEVARIGIARGLGALFQSGALPLPTDESALMWTSAIVAGVMTSLTDQALRVIALRRWVEPVDERTGALLGLGHGGAEALLTALLVLGMATIAIVGRGSSFDELEAMGFEGRSAVRVGMKVLAWWEASPSDALLAAGQQLAIVGMHVGLGIAVARGVGRHGIGRGALWLATAFVVQAVFASLLSWIAAKTPGLGVELAVHGGAAMAGLALAVWATRRPRV